MTRCIVLIAIVLVLLWAILPLQAGAVPLEGPAFDAPASASAVYIFQTDMFGRNQVPPIDSGAWGFVRFFFSDDRLSADYTVDVKGLSGSLVEGADIHRATPGMNGPVVRHLAGGGFIVTSGRLRLTPAELDEMIAGGWYVSLKTKAHPDGELRGQVIVPDDFISGTAPPPVIVAQTQPPVQIPPPPAAQAQPPREAAPVEAPSGVTIRPPNTGEAGLKDAGLGTGRALLVGLAAVVLGVGLIFLSGSTRER